MAGICSVAVVTRVPEVGFETTLDSNIGFGSTTATRCGDCGSRCDGSCLTSIGQND